MAFREYRRKRSFSYGAYLDTLEYGNDSDGDSSSSSSSSPRGGAGQSSSSAGRTFLRAILVLVAFAFLLSVATSGSYTSKRGTAASSSSSMMTTRGASSLAAVPRVDQYSRLWCQEGHILERHTHDSQHGDVCRDPRTQGFECPVEICRKASTSSPYCLQGRSGESPCRVPRNERDRPYGCDPNGGSRGVCILREDGSGGGASGSGGTLAVLQTTAAMASFLPGFLGGSARGRRYRDETCDDECGYTSADADSDSDAGGSSTTAIDARGGTTGTGTGTGTGGGKCRDDWDCSLAGVCDFTGRCRCDAWASGDDCSYLNFEPVDQHRVGYLRDSRYSSWGGNAVRGSDGLWHMYVAEIACGMNDLNQHRCGLNNWETTSQVSHVVSDNVEGPYERRELVLQAEHHNPTLHVSPADGSWNLYSISGPRGPIEVVSSFDEGKNWSPPTGVSKEQNPGPVMHENGTVTMFYRGDDATVGPGGDLPADSCSTEYIGRQVCETRTKRCTYAHHPPPVSTITSASSSSLPQAPSSELPRKSVLDHTAEDPSVFVDHRGNYHMLVNALPYKCAPKLRQGGHAWSRDGVNWSSVRVGAFNTTFALKEQPTGGGGISAEEVAPETRSSPNDPSSPPPPPPVVTEITCERRERPQMIMDPDRPGVPLALVTGVTGCPQRRVWSVFGNDYSGAGDSFTLVQLMGRDDDGGGGTD